jgi:hypothetical protein
MTARFWGALDLGNRVLAELLKSDRRDLQGRAGEPLAPVDGNAWYGGLRQGAYRVAPADLHSRSLPPIGYGHVVRSEDATVVWLPQ